MRVQQHLKIHPGRQRRSPRMFKTVLLRNEGSMKRWSCMRWHKQSACRQVYDLSLGYSAIVTHTERPKIDGETSCHCLSVCNDSWSDDLRLILEAAGPYNKLINQNIRRVALE